MQSMSKTNSNVYLDYAASTPVRPQVLEVMRPYWRDAFANPQSSHADGRQAQEAVRQAREDMADTLSVKPSELVFTSGATEANSLAIKGRIHSSQEKTAVAVSDGNHPSVLELGGGSRCVIQQLSLQADGRIDLSQLETSLNKKTSVVTVPYVNSVVGSIERLRELSTRVGDILDDKHVVHTDASQAGNYLPLQPEHLGVDMMTLNSHKLYGPKGIGLLWVRSGTKLSSVLLSAEDYAVGDYQMLRPGTPPVPLIIGFAKALAIAQNNYKQLSQKVRTLQHYTIEQLETLPCEVDLNGGVENRVANNIHISIANVDHDFLATKLDQQGVSLSTTTACQSEQGEFSMLDKIPNTPDAGLRITLGRHTSKEHINYLLNALRTVIDT